MRGPRVEARRKESARGAQRVARVDPNPFSVRSRPTCQGSPVQDRAKAARSIRTATFLLGDAARRIRTATFLLGDASRRIRTATFLLGDVSRSIRTATFLLGDAARRIRTATFLLGDVSRSIRTATFLLGDAARRIRTATFLLGDVSRPIRTATFLLGDVSRSIRTATFLVGKAASLLGHASLRIVRATFPIVEASPPIIEATAPIGRASFRVGNAPFVGELAPPRSKGGRSSGPNGAPEAVLRSFHLLNREGRDFLARGEANFAKRRHRHATRTGSKPAATARTVGLDVSGASVPRWGVIARSGSARGPLCLRATDRSKTACRRSSRRRRGSRPIRR